MTAHIPDTDAGRALREAALSPSATAPVVAALPGDDQPRFTQGPHWVEGSIYDGYAACVVGRVATPGEADRDTRTLAHVRGFPDAMLFAAASDMYEALEAYVSAYENGTGTVYIIDQVRNALAKARGEA